MRAVLFVMGLWCWRRKEREGTVFRFPSFEGETNKCSGKVRKPDERAWMVT